MKRLDYNAPVTLSFAIISFFVLVASWMTGGSSTTKFFCVYASSWSNPLTYVRLFCHVLGHADLSHYLGNMTLFILVGPAVEEEYGSVKLLLMMAVTAVVTGIVQMFCFPGTALLGASGIVFLLIILSSMINYHRGTIPLTFIAVVVLYLGQEIYNAIFLQDNISQLTHIIGGVLGIIFGFTVRRRYSHK